MKKLIVFLMIVVFVLCLSGCNRQIIDFTYRYDYAYISLPNGDYIEGPIDSWRDYDDEDQLQIKIDGQTYLTHASRVVMVSK